jgi:O-antigen/teichoic acid export membrane protein
MMKRVVKTGVARNTAWMFLGQGLRLAIQAGYFILIARCLGATNYGAFVGVVALVAIAVPFGPLGSGIILIKHVSRDSNLFPIYWGRALVTTGLCSAILFAGVILVSHVFLPATIPLRLVLLVASSDLFGLSLILMSGQAFQALEKLNWTATIHVLLSASRFLGAVVLVSIHRHPSALQWGYLYFCSTAAVVAAAVLLVSVKLGRPLFNWRRSYAELREGFYFSAGLSAQTIYNDIDKTMLARLGTLDATGIYGAAYRLIDVSFVPLSSLLAAAYPVFFQKGANGIASGVRYAKFLLVRALGYSAVACLCLLLFAGIVPHIIGPEYTRTVEALRWLSLLPVLKALHYYFSDALSGAGYQAVRMFIQVAVAIFNVLINLWLIPAYSWRGAAWSSLVSDGLLAFGIGTAVLVLCRRSQRANRRIRESAVAVTQA